ncbi:MAG: VPLPA-CTERM sorting domain-containing protein [Pseudomonadota bacterium]
MLAATLLVAGPASATFVTASLTEVGDDLVFAFEGTVDPTGLNFFPAGVFPQNELGPSVSWITSLPGEYSFYESDGSGVFPTFGPGPLDSYSRPVESVSVGDAFGFNDEREATIYVPRDYVPNDPLSGTATFFDLTLAEIGAIEGVYVGNIGRTTVEFTVGAAGGSSAIPLPAGAWLMLTAMGAVAASARRRRT